MRLLIIIVQEVDYPRLSDAFVDHEIRATKFLTEGLYLNKINITLMVCIQEDRLEEVFGYIRESCTERIEEREVSEYNGQYFVDVVRGIKIGGATVFNIGVDEILKF